MEIRSMEELVEACEREQKTIGEIMLMMEAKNRGKDEATIFNMMEERLLKMKEAVETGVDGWFNRAKRNFRWGYSQNASLHQSR